MPAPHRSSSDKMLNHIFNSETSYDEELKVWSGPTEQSLYNEDLTIGEIIFKKLQSGPQRIFQISHTDNTKLTRSEMLINSVKVSAYLRQQGLTKESDIVGIIGRNTTHIAALAYGCMFNGTTFHAISTRYEEQTMRKLYDMTKPKIIFCDAEDCKKLKNIAEDLRAKLVTISGCWEGVTTMQDVLQTIVPVHFRPQHFERGIDKTLAILCSSGTTGTPKSVTISNSRNIFEAHSYLTPDDIQYAPSTLDWLSGVMILITGGVYGSVRLICTEPSSPIHFLDICKQYTITWTVMSNLFLATLAYCPEINEDQLKSLRYLIFGGGRTLASTLEKMQSYLLGGGILRNVYGMTELGTCAAFNNSVDLKPTSVGHLAANLRMRIVDDSGNSLGPNTVGEILCHNAQYWSGYFGNPTASAEIQDSEGWFHTGDVGYFDNDNFLHIMDRKKDMLRFMGRTYYPYEIEQWIGQMPQVAEVCVFGIFNKAQGDAAAASVVPKSGSILSSYQVQDFVTQNISESFKHLHGGVQIVSGLDKFAYGKINRESVKTAFINRTTVD